MAKIIEAKAVITGEDKTGKMFDSIAKKFEKLAKAGEASKGIDQMAAAIGRAQKQAAAIDKFFGARSAFGEARTRFRAAQEAVDGAARAMRAGGAAAGELQRAYARAQREVKSASRALDHQKAVLIGSQHALDAMGISANSAASHQARLRAAVDQTTAAIGRQERRAQRMRHFFSPEGAAGYATGAAAGYVSAAGIAHGVARTVEAGARYQHEGTVLSNVGRTPAEMRAIDAASRRTVSLVPTSTYTENRKVITETSGAFGSVEHAIENLAFMQKVSAVLHSAAGSKISDDAGSMGNKLARVFEIRGTANNTATFQREAGELARAMVFSGGTFNPTEALNFSQQAKGAMQTYSQRFLTRIVPSISTEVGGERAGTAANAFRNVIMGKVRDKKQTAEWIKLGLIDKGQVVGGKGSPLTWKAGAVLGTDQALRDPLKWAEDVLIPKLQKDGVNVDDPLELSKRLAVLFRNQNANMFAEIVTQARSRQRLHKDEALIDQTKTVAAAYDNNLATDATQSVKAFSAALENLMTVASSPVMIKAAQALTSVAGGMQATANWLAQHPKTAVTGGATVAGLSLGGAGWLAYKLSTGFGLQKSALMLSASAEALSAAAGRLGGPSKGLSDMPGPHGPNSPQRLGAGSLADTVLQIARDAQDRTKDLPTLTWGDWEYTMKERLGLGTGNKKFSGDNGYAGIHYAFPSLKNGLSATSLAESFGLGKGPIEAELKGAANVTGSVRIEIAPSGELLRVVDRARGATATLHGTLNANGPGSTGKSLPESAAPQYR